MIHSKYERVLLVGFMGAGKTSVGRRLADALGWRFVDFDDAVEAMAGASVREIFEAHGEAHFRELEDRVASRLLPETGVVLGAGGGWAAVPRRLETVPVGTATVWLDVGLETALGRAAGQPGARPLLEGPDARDRAAHLMRERRRFYAAARWRVDTEGSSVEDVTARILKILAEGRPTTELE